MYPSAMYPRSLLAIANNSLGVSRRVVNIAYLTHGDHYFQVDKFFFKGLVLFHWKSNHQSLY
jgi:hypothetical protein